MEMPEFETLRDLSFEPADRGRFPGLYLAWDALRAREGSAAVLNAANEEAVCAFLERRVGFAAIHEVNCRTLETVGARLGPLHTVGDLIDLDRKAREAARRHAKELAG